MKVRYTSGKLSVEVEGDQQKEVFRQLATFQEVFEHSKCGKCSAEDVRFVVRTVGDNDFYEMHCPKCRARLSFGQHKGKDGTLFPKRKDDNGWLPNGGWVVFDPSTKKES